MNINIFKNQQVTRFHYTTCIGQKDDQFQPEMLVNAIYILSHTDVFMYGLEGTNFLFTFLARHNVFFFSIKKRMFTILTTIYFFELLTDSLNHRINKCIAVLDVTGLYGLVQRVNLKSNLIINRWNSGTRKNVAKSVTVKMPGTNLAFRRPHSRQRSDEIFTR